jgi:hypothetical protein
MTTTWRELKAQGIFKGKIKKEKCPLRPRAWCKASGSPKTWMNLTYKERRDIWKCHYDSNIPMKTLGLWHGVAPTSISKILNPDTREAMLGETQDQT